LLPDVSPISPEHAAVTAVQHAIAAPTKKRLRGFILFFLEDFHQGIARAANHEGVFLTGRSTAQKIRGVDSLSRAPEFIQPIAR